jgi:transcriptional regulator with GAF, ATPase, and Fis domain
MDDTLSMLRQQCCSSVYLRTLDQVQRFAKQQSVPVLLEGESGTGKTWIARLIHLRSPRAARPFLPMDLGSVDDSLAAGELFGHVAGAYTGACGNRPGLCLSANGGTLFLDEIGKASPIVQSRLLGLLEGRDMRPVGSDRAVPIDLRIIAASNISLEQLVAEGRMLPDVLARLQMFCIHLPALRERRADIPILVGGSRAASRPDLRLRVPAKDR